MTGLGLVLFWAALAVLFQNGLLTAGYIRARSALARAPRTRGRTVERGLAVVTSVGHSGPAMARSNASLVDQRYPGPLSVAFVAADKVALGLAHARRAHGANPIVTFGVSTQVRGLSAHAADLVRGWGLSDAPLVAFCDADVTLEPDALARCAAHFDDPRVGVVIAPLLDCGHPLAALSSLDGLLLAHAGDLLGQPWSRARAGVVMVRRDAIRDGDLAGALADAAAVDLRLASHVEGEGLLLRVARPVGRAEAGGSTASWLGRSRARALATLAEAPALVVASVLLHPIVAPLVALAVTSAAWPVLVASVVWRTALTLAAGNLAPAGVVGLWGLGKPLADVVHFAVCASALAPGLARRSTSRHHAGPRRAAVATRSPTASRESGRLAAP